jgi:mRNA interferase RelE/StbE
MFRIELKERAIKDLKSMPKQDAQRILQKIKVLENGLSGDIKRLTNFTPEYRMRVGDYRVLFEVDESVITVYRIKHRKEAYR